MFAVFEGRSTAPVGHFLFTLICSCLLLNLFFVPPIHAASGGQVEVVAVVEPVREVVVNKDSQIQEIISNTDTNVAPSIWLDKVGYKQQPMTSAINNQYLSIIRGLNTHTSYGIIYNRSNNSSIAISSKKFTTRLLNEIPGISEFSVLLQKI